MLDTSNLRSASLAIKGSSLSAEAGGVSLAAVVLFYAIGRYFRVIPKLI